MKKTVIFMAVIIVCLAGICLYQYFRIETLRAEPCPGPATIVKHADSDAAVMAQAKKIWERQLDQRWKDVRAKGEIRERMLDDCTGGPERRRQIDKDYWDASELWSDAHMAKYYFQGRR